MMQNQVVRTMVMAGLVSATAAGATERSDAPARQALAQLVAHDFAGVHAQMSPEMAAAVGSPEALAAIWREVTGPAGDFQRVDSVEQSTAAGVTATLLHCTFAHGPLDIVLAFDGQGHIAGMHFPPPTPTADTWSPPSYAAPDRFDERDVTVGTPPLPGKLTLPRGAGPFAAVVLVHGSGPQDENETLGPHQPFHDLALGLASRGIAVVRYRKRTLVYPPRDRAHFTVAEETTDDARAAVALLAKTAQIDPARIFVVGHSLGAVLAPRIAAHNPLVAGIVIMAGPTRPLEDVIVEQVTARGTPADVAAAQAAAARIRDPKLLPSDSVELLGTRIPGSYFLDLRGDSPADAAAQLDVPILVLQGDRDIQVRAIDFAGWQRALAQRPRAKLVRYPTLTHLFTEGQGTLADYQQASHVAPAVIDDLVAFIAPELHK